MKTLEPAPLPYIRAFDGLRALAVLLVMLHHWPFPALTLPFGWAGVNIFFVLSGFLITRILLNARQKPLKEYLGRFYRNRFLRIFPLYYAYLAGIILLLLSLNGGLPDPPLVFTKGLAAAKTELFYLLTYTYNFQDLWHLRDGQDNSHDVRFFAHLWSLSVEEQFYLFFPFVIYFLPEKPLKCVLLGLVLLSPALRLVTGEFLREKQNGFFTGMLLCRLPFYHLDAFAVGGLISLSPLHRFRNPEKWLAGFAAFSLVLGLAAVFWLRKNGIEISWKSLGFDSPLYQYQQVTGNLFMDMRYFLTFSLVNILAGLLLLSALKANLFSRILQHNLPAFLGRISYGVYIFHFPLLVFLLLALEFSGFQNALKNNPLLEIVIFGIYGFVTVILAAFSFRYFERYFLKRKR